MEGQEVKSSDIIQPLAVKLQIVSVSVEATAMTLRIDDVIAIQTSLSISILILTPYHSHTPQAHYKITATLHHPTAHKGTRAGGYLLGAPLTPHDAGRLIGGLTPPYPRTTDHESWVIGRWSWCGGS